MSNPNELAKAKKVYLSDWLNQAKSVQAAVPKVQQQLELAVWEHESLSMAPSQAASIVPGDITSSLEEDLETWHQALPEIPHINLTVLDASVATTSTTSAIMYHFVNHERRSADPQVRNWASRCGKRYESLQEQLYREKKVRNLLHNLKRNLATEFDDAVSAYRAALAGTNTQPNAGIALRNVMEHYKGEVMNIARQHPREQKITWQQMSDRLVDNVGVARHRFVKQEKTWCDLQQCLSKLAKGQIQLDQSGLKSIFTEFLDHLYIVLSLINVGGGN